ncbi:MAG: glycoside hydrolase family 36 protein [Myxococcota bacterium]|nr:glycoside hydrolase family 36 protein [Myxococcota bacterium]
MTNHMPIALLAGTLCFASCAQDQAHPLSSPPGITSLDIQRQDACAQATWSLTDTVVLRKRCGNAEYRLTPGIFVDREWVAASRCTGQASQFICDIDQLGQLRISTNGDRIDSEFTARTSLQYGGHGFRGTLRQPGAYAWLSNGFQSWSQSGVLAIPASVGPTERASALEMTGDLEVLRAGYELSWWHSFSASRETSAVTGALTADTFKSWVSLYGESPSLKILIASGGTGESLAVGMDQSVPGESWYVALGTTLNDMLRDYGHNLPTRTGSTLVPEAGWNSWYELWDTVDEVAVRENANLAKQVLDELVPNDGPPLRIVIDDGWQRAWGDWHPNAKFSDDLLPLVESLRADDFEVGIWLAPLLVIHDHPVVKEHPEWFLPNATFDHITHGPMRILDVTHPEAANHLKTIIRRVTDWGFDLLKIDFLFAGTFEDDRHRPTTGLNAYNQALAIIREAAGQRTNLLLVGAPPIAGFQYGDAWRLGPDIATTAFDVSWFFLPNVARTLGARWPYCYAVLCDGDPPLFRTLTQNEVELGAWAAVMAGGALFLSDDLRALALSRVNWLTPIMAATALAGEPSIPLDVPEAPPSSLTSALADHNAQTNQHVVPVTWQLPSGDVVDLNFSDVEVTTKRGVIGPRSLSVGASEDK